MLKLAELYDTGTGGVSHNLDKAWELYMELGIKGDAEAQRRLGNICFNVFADYPCALSWYQKSADLGDADGIKNLAYMNKYKFVTLEEKQQADEFYRTVQPITEAQKQSQGFKDAMKKAIANPKNFSRAALSAQTVGTALVQFEYTGGGEATDVSIFRSSGNDFEDSAAVQAVEAATLPDRPSSMSKIHHFVVALDFGRRY